MQSTLVHHRFSGRVLAWLRRLRRVKQNGTGRRPGYMDALWNRLNVEALLTRLITWLPSLFAALTLLLVFWIVYRATRPALHGVLVRAHFDRALVDMLLSVFRFALLVFAVIMAASQLGINVGAALAGLGVVGLTIGFAAKDSLGNIMAGFLIFWDKPFHVNDWITLDDKYGQVCEITMRTTRLRTLNNTWVIVPNEAVINRTLVNHSTKGNVRLQVPVGIAYKESIDSAREAILRAVKRIEKVLGDPAPGVVVAALGDSSVDLIVHAWIADAGDEKPTHFKIVEAAKKALDEAGIEIPFPHLQLFVENVEDRVWEDAQRVMRTRSAA